MRIKNFLYIIVVLVFLASNSAVQAQNFDIAYTYEVSDQEAISGDIVMTKNTGEIVRTDNPYDPRILGVFQENPIVVFKDVNNATGSAIVRNGDTFINVTNFNGEIKKGDFITSSPISGKGMKASQSGYIIGVATGDFLATDQTVNFENQKYNLGSVPVALRIEYAELTTARSGLTFLNALNAALFKNIQDPEKFTNILRYLIAGVITVIAVTFSFFTISKSLSKGIESIGRNPLAKTSIQISMALNFVFVLIGLFIVGAIDFILVLF